MIFGMFGQFPFIQLVGIRYTSVHPFRPLGPQNKVANSNKLILRCALFSTRRQPLYVDTSAHEHFVPWGVDIKVTNFNKLILR